MRKLFLMAAASLMFASPAFAKTHEVQMLNKNPDNAKQTMVFSPAYLHIESGDTVIFKATDKGHNSVSMKGMIPEGATAWKSKMNKDFEITLDAQGIYAYKCLPHYGMGMVGIIQVGDDTSNLEAVQSAKAPKKARAAFDGALENVK